MITLEECVRVAGISKNQLILGATPSTRHLSLLASYLLNLDRGVASVRRMIVADLHGFVDLGQPHRAADTLLVLRMFLTEYPEALPTTPPTKASMLGTGAWSMDDGAWRRSGRERRPLSARGCRPQLRLVATSRS